MQVEWLAALTQIADKLQQPLDIHVLSKITACSA